MDNTRPSLLTPPALPQADADILRWTAAFHQTYFQQLTQLVSLLGGNLRWQNLRSNLQTVNVAGAAPVVFSFAHNLGKIPEIALCLPDGNGLVYATPANRALWTNTSITLTSTVSPAALTLLVL